MLSGDCCKFVFSCSMSLSSDWLNPRPSGQAAPPLYLIWVVSPFLKQGLPHCGNALKRNTSSLVPRAAAAPPPPLPPVSGRGAAATVCLNKLAEASTRGCSTHSLLPPPSLAKLYSWCSVVGPPWPRELTAGWRKEVVGGCQLRCWLWWRCGGVAGSTAVGARRQGNADAHIISTNCLGYPAQVAPWRCSAQRVMVAHLLLKL
ncbi:hypothetical protein E2C01_019721 [Portunus trituberculatus]|uniref:Uncharacterized protein n=1 Tax=Portunus trituberculatus TaxID=210409 RepID=A0A5B7DYQ2_PORTR|nr:hypothetical protein [Portunus trituberculatus]